MTALRRFLPIVLLFSASLAAQVSPCPGTGGLSLLLTGGRTGDAFSLTIQGAPGATGLLGLDVGGGPIATPVGLVCLSFTPFLQLLPIGLDGTGSLQIAGVLPPDPGLSGLTLFMQAAVAQAGLPVPTLSPGASMAFRPPRWFFVDAGSANPIGGIVPGSILAYDALTETPGWSAALTTTVADATRVPYLGLVLVLTSAGQLSAYNEETGNLVFSVPVPSGPGTPGRIAALEDGSGLIILYPGTPPSPFTGGTPGAVVTMGLPVTTPLLNIPLPGAFPTDLVLVPGTTWGYVREGSVLTRFDFITGAVSPPLNLGTTFGSVVDWRVGSGQILVLFGGITPSPFGGTSASSAVQAVDVPSNTPVQAAPLPLAAAGATLVRAGPGPTGGALLALLPQQGAVQVVAPDLSAVLATVTVPVGTGHLDLSPGGGEWLLVQSGSVPLFGSPVPGTLLRMDPATLAVSTVAALPAQTQSLLLPLGSDALRKAYLVNASNSLLTFATDPAGAPSPLITLPIAAVARALGNRP